MKNLLFLISLILSLNSFSIISADLEQNSKPQNQGTFECPGYKQFYSTLDDMKDCTQTLECYGHGLVEHHSETSKQKKTGNVKNGKKGHPKTNHLGERFTAKALIALSITKKHPCKMCDKKFRKPSGLKRHEIIHMNKNPYSCKYCSKSFNNDSNLKRHENIHTHIKLYRCPIEGCPKKFKRSDNVTQHLRHRHKSK